MKSNKTVAKAIQRSLERIVQNVDADDVIVYLWQEGALSVVEYQTVQAELVGERKVSEKMRKLCKLL